VLLHAPSFAFQAPGGGENQLIQTARHLEAMGLPVRLFCSWSDRLERARLLHLFGMSREGLELARRAKARGTPVVLSPICWFQPGALWNLEHTWARKVGSLATWSLRRLCPKLPGWRRDLLELCDRILPNSQAEARQLCVLFGVNPERIAIIPNGVLCTFREASPALFRGRFGDGEFVLFVGRVEPRKNILGLIRAVRSLRLRLVILGAAPPECRTYLERCRVAGGDAVSWLPSTDHEDPFLASAYAAARVLALPSWFETPGLVALEAALAGTTVVITPFGSTREYFGERVLYARPDRLGEIKSTIARGWSEGPDPRLAGFVASHYLWPRVAERTAEVYGRVAR
jgi:glycosyltransferase involved in cell wall biosynthesis